MAEASPAGKCMIAAVFMWIGVAFMVPGSLNTLKFDDALARRGRPGVATVQYGTTRMTTSAGDDFDDRTAYLLYTRYEVNGKEYSQRFAVDHKTYQAKQYGSTVDIVYDSADPSVAQLAGAPTGQGPWGLVWSGIFLLAGIALPIAAYKLKHAKPVPTLNEALEEARHHTSS